jgi:hypothetical protein
MKLKVSLAKLSSPGFVGGFRTLRKSRFGSAEAWSIYRAGEQIDRELERYFAIRKEIEDRFAQNDGKTKFIPKESVAAFQKEIEDLGKKEVELCLEQKVRLPEDCRIEPDEIGALIEAQIIELPETAESTERTQTPQQSSPAPGRKGAQEAKPRI